MHKQKGAVEIILVLLLVAALGLAGYFWWQNRQQKFDAGGSSIEKQQLAILNDEIPVSDSTTANNDVVRITNLLSTDDWQTVTFKGVSFKVLSDTRVEKHEDFVLYYNKYKAEEILVPSKVGVVDYNGGSRRKQFLSLHGDGGVTFTKYCQPLYVDALFGDVRALQIANNGGECQGGGGGIVSVVGKDKLFIHYDLNYDDRTNEIHRSPGRDTLISTLKRLQE